MKIWFLIRKVKDDKVREKNEKRKEKAFLWKSTANQRF